MDFPPPISAARPYRAGSGEKFGWIGLGRLQCFDELSTPWEDGPNKPVTSRVK